MRARVTIGLGGLLVVCLLAAIWGTASGRPGQDLTCHRRHGPAHCQPHR